MNSTSEYPPRQPLSVEDFGIWEEDLVLDVGCSDRPVSRANVGIDVRRAMKRRKDFHFVVASAEALPFKDKVFGFIYCAHVIEHVEDPLAACAEISRVGVRGFLICPSKFSEVVRPTDIHHWMVSLVKGELLFERKFPELFPAAKWAERMTPEIQSKQIDVAYERRFPAGVFNVILHWFEKIECKVI